MTYATLLIDMQRFLYWTEHLSSVINNQLRLLRFSHEKGFAVVVTNMAEGPEMISELRLEVEKGARFYIPKRKTDAFTNSGLEYLFRSQGITQVLLAGNNRDICCLDTAKHIKKSGRKVVTSLDLLFSSGVIPDHQAQKNYKRLGQLYQSTDELIAAVRTEVQP